MKHIIKFSLLLLVLVLANANAYGQLMISPTTVMFDERDRVKEVILINTDNKTNTYRVSWEEKKQTPEFVYAELSEDEKETFRKASDLIRFSPRQVTLEPGERQAVKMLLRRDSDMKEGDYRSHLTFSVIPQNLERQAQNGQGEGMQMMLNMFVNYSMPVIVRHGKPKHFVDINELELVREAAFPFNVSKVKVNLKRQGDYGSYGRLVIEGKNPNSGESEELGRINGFNFLHENTELTYFLPVQKQSMFAAQESIVVKFINEFGEQDVIASKELKL